MNIPAGPSPMSSGLVSAGDDVYAPLVEKAHSIGMTAEVGVQSRYYAGHFPPPL